MTPEKKKRRDQIKAFEKELKDYPHTFEEWIESQKRSVAKSVISIGSPAKKKGGGSVNTSQKHEKKEKQTSPTRLTPQEIQKRKKRKKAKKKEATNPIQERQRAVFEQTLKELREAQAKRTAELEAQLQAEKQSIAASPSSNGFGPTIHSTQIIEWSDIVFYSRSIKLGPWGNWPWPASRQSFNGIKPLFDLRGRPIRIVVNNRGKVEKIQDEDFFSNVVLLMQVKDDMENFYNRFISYRAISDLSDTFSKIPHKYWQLYYRSKDPRYLKYLCDNLDSNRRVVPVAEAVIGSDGRGYKLDDGFLFTSERRGIIYIIWEAVEISKATYVFRSSPQSYSDDLQAIYNYIVSDQVNKRSTLLRYGELRRRYHLVSTPWHTDYLEWRARIAFYTGNR